MEGRPELVDAEGGSNPLARATLHGPGSVMIPDATLPEAAHSRAARGIQQPLRGPGLIRLGPANMRESVASAFGCVATGPAPIAGVVTNNKGRTP